MDSPEITHAVAALRRRMVPGTRTILGIAGAPGSGTGGNTSPGNGGAQAPSP